MANSESDSDGDLDPNDPISVTEIFRLSSLDINEDFITSANVTMESDKYICVRESDPQNRVVIIDMSYLMAPLEKLVTADSTLMNPNMRIIAFKGHTQDHLRMPGHVVVFWKWISPKTLGLVTQTSVYHWSIEGDFAPVKMFDRTANLANNQIINYKCDPTKKIDEFCNGLHENIKRRETRERREGVCSRETNLGTPPALNILETKQRLKFEFKRKD